MPVADEPGVVAQPIVSRIIILGSNAFRYLPGWAAAVLLRVVQPCLRIVSARHRRRHQILRRIAPKEPTVLQGPFQGMEYIQSTSSSQLLPKVLGTYELELHGAIEELCQREPDVIVDIGSAEGYYATGLSLRNPAAKVICFDTDRLANRLLLKLAEVNGTLGRISVRGHCNPFVLEQVLGLARNPSVICDVEGAEQDILRPDLAPHLTHAMVIVELHEKQRPGVTAELRERFAETHDIEAVRVRPRSTAAAPSLQLPDHDALFAMDEQRLADQTWFVMRPRIRG